MARDVIEKPAFPQPPVATGSWERALIRTLNSAFQEVGVRTNLNLPRDGDRTMEAPVPLQHSTVANLPAAGDWEGSLIYVTNDTGGPAIAWSDGSDWRRVLDNQVVTT